MAPIEVHTAGQADAEAWDAFVGANDAATAYQRWGWRRVFTDAFRLQPHYLVARRAGGVCGVLPLVRQNNPVQGRFLVSLPFVNYAGLLAADDAAAQALLEQAKGLVHSERAVYAELRHPPGVRCEAPVLTRKVRVTLALPADEETLSKQLGAKLRSQIRRPQKEGMQVECGGLEHLDAFYDVLSVKWRELGSPIYSRRAFRAIWDAFPKDNLILLVRWRERAVAAGWLHQHGPRIEINWAGTLPESDHLSPNMLLYWGALTKAVERGCTVFDFGRSTVDSGTHRFKMQWGGVAAPLPWHYLVGSGSPPEDAPGGGAGAALQRVWRRLPLAFTRSFGHFLARRLPL